MAENDTASYHSDGVGHSVSVLPPRTAAVYATVAGLWIVASDTVAAITVGDVSRSEYLLNLTKGLAFVAATTGVLYLVLRRWRERLERGLDEAELERQRFNHLVEATEDVFAVLDDDGRLTYVSPRLVSSLGWQVGDVIGEQGRAFVHPEDRDDAIDFLRRTKTSVRSLPPTTFRLLATDGRWHHIEVATTDLRHVPSVGGVVVHGRDVTEQRMAEVRLEYAVAHDPITGVANRVTYELALGEAGLGLQHADRDLAIVVIDLLAFREVNAQVGRALGDEVLRQVVERFEQSLTPLTLGRIGADEFSAALAVPAVSDPVEWTVERCHQLLNDVAKPYSVDGTRVDVSVDVGAAVSRLPAPVTDVLVDAESNLHRAKRHPDQIVVTLHDPSTRSRQNLLQPTKLHEALESDQFVLYYQPQYELATGRMVGVEALLRWRHPTEGLLTPSTFLDVVTRGTLLPLVTRFVLREATRQAAAWQRNGHDISVSVNLSLGDLRRRALTHDVIEALDDAGLDPTRLCLELTEHTLFAERERSLPTMHRLRRRGVNFSIDDFGTGYSSLAHLRTLPVDELKIDSMFVADMTDNAIDRSIVSAAIDLGEAGGMTILAEGIEKASTWQALVESGCGRGQGYLMSPPVPAEDVTFEPFLVSS